MKLKLEWYSGRVWVLDLETALDPALVLGSRSRICPDPEPGLI